MVTNFGMRSRHSKKGQGEAYTLADWGDAFTRICTKPTDPRDKHRRDTHTSMQMTGRDETKRMAMAPR